MKQIVTKAIILSRRDYQETDRILNVLTPDCGKVSLIAKGVRKSGSKMAGGIELFSVSEVGFIEGKSQLCTLTSSRLISHYGSIVSDVNRTMYGYEILKVINKVTEENAESTYFDLLQSALNGLNDVSLDLDIVGLWFTTHLLALSGHGLELHQNSQGEKLSAGEDYMFDLESMAFRDYKDGPYKANHIKLLRLVTQVASPEALKNLEFKPEIAKDCTRLLVTVRNQVLHV